MSLDRNLSLTGEAPRALNSEQKGATAVGVLGLIIMLLAAFNVEIQPRWLYLTLSLSALASGIIWFAKASYSGLTQGIKNDGAFLKPMTSRGTVAYATGIGLTSFYIILYFFPELIGLNKEGTNTGLVSLFDPLSQLLAQRPASQWFVYGTLYTIAILFFAVKFMWKYRHNRYQKLRTFSVSFFQLGFAFIIPELMARLNSENFSLPYYDF